MSITLDDDLIARRVEAAAPINTPLPIIPVNQQGVSTLGPAPELSPILKPPVPNIMYKILAAHTTTEMLASKRAENFDVEASKSQAEIKRLDEEKEKALEKELEAAKNRDSWSTLAVVAQYVTSVSAVVVGSTLGGPAGTLIALGGIAGGATRLLNDTHMMDKIVSWCTTSQELQTSIKQNIELGSMYLQIGLGLAGGFAAWHAGAFAAMQAANAASYAQRAASIMGTSSQIMNGGAQFGKLYEQKHMSDMRADIQEIELSMKEEQQGLTRQTKEVGEVLSNNDAEIKVIKRLIEQFRVEGG